jgi:hypothetical protein
VELMYRMKTTDTDRRPTPTGSWLAGMVIGGTIMTMAAGAAMVGATMAIRDAGGKAT